MSVKSLLQVHECRIMLVLTFLMLPGLSGSCYKLFHDLFRLYINFLGASLLILEISTYAVKFVAWNRLLLKRDGTEKVSSSRRYRKSASTTKYINTSIICSQNDNMDSVKILVPKICLFGMTEQWLKYLDKGGIIGTILTDLSKMQQRRLKSVNLLTLY